MPVRIFRAIASKRSVLDEAWHLANSSTMMASRRCFARRVKWLRRMRLPALPATNGYFAWGCSSSFVGSSGKPKSRDGKEGAMKRQAGTVIRKVGRSLTSSV
jgi:hypothetical protein